MPRFKVRHKYASSHNGRQFGPWEAGDEIDLDGPDAEWVERDSPGALEPVEQAKPKPNRQHQSVKTRDS